MNIEIPPILLNFVATAIKNELDSYKQMAHDNKEDAELIKYKAQRLLNDVFQESERIERLDKRMEELAKDFNIQ